MAGKGPEKASRKDIPKKLPKSPERVVAQINSGKKRKFMNEPLAVDLTKVPKKTPKPAPKRPKAKEKKEKKKPTFQFPNGLELELSKDKAAAKEWANAENTPLGVLKKQYPNKTVKDIEKSSLDWITKHYVINIPLVKIRPEDLDKNISKYFKVRDLVKIDKTDKDFMDKKGTWAKHSQFMIRDKNGEYYWNVAKIDPNLCKFLDEIRLEAGRNLEVDEGVRPNAYNTDMYMAKYGHVVYSPHISGRAVDLRRRGDPDNGKFWRAIVETLRGRGGGFGHGPTIYHVDTKIQIGKKGKDGKLKGSWILDEKTGKVKLRMREWIYPK